MEFDIKQLHCIQMTILKEFDRVCKTNNLRYCLAFGTLLGAIRNNGFIPWDDDVDVLMPYDDYVKLSKLPSKEWKSPFFLQSSDSDKNYRKCYMKLRKSDTTLIVDDVAHQDINHGIAIDIYPMIHLSDSESELKKQYRDTMLYMLLQVGEPPKNHGTIMRLGSKIILTALPDNMKSRLKKSYLNKVTKYQMMDTQYSFVMVGNPKVMREKLSNSIFDDMEEHAFENASFPVPCGYKDWLSARYGANYMDPPPKEMQGVKLEHFLKIDFDHPYTFYKGKYYCKK